MYKVGDKVIIKDAMDTSYIGKIGIVEEVSKHTPYSCKLNIDGKEGSWANAWLFSCIEPLEVKPRPPLGVAPKYIWDAKRLADLTRAIKEYTEAQLKVPNEWIDEYNDLVKLHSK